MAAEEQNTLVKTRSREISDILALRKLSGAGWKVALLSSYIQSLDSEIESCERRLSEKTSEQEAVRVELTAAMKERKVMEKLAEKEKATWAMDVKRLAQSYLDESAATGFIRKAHAV
jgi:flagellar export protein FliJ